MKHPRILTTQCHLRGSQLPSGNGRHARVQRPGHPHGHMGRRARRSTQMGMGSRAHINTAACNRVDIFEQAGVWRHPATHAHMCARTLSTAAHLPGLRMHSPTRHGVLLMSKGTWGVVKMNARMHRVYVHTQQSLGWEHTWTAQASPQKDLLPVADNTGNPI